MTCVLWQTPKNWKSLPTSLWLVEGLGRPQIESCTREKTFRIGEVPNFYAEIWLLAQIKGRNNLFSRLPMLLVSIILLVTCCPTVCHQLVHLALVIRKIYDFSAHSVHFHGPLSYVKIENDRFLQVLQQNVRVKVYFSIDGCIILFRSWGWWFARQALHLVSHNILLNYPLLKSSNCLFRKRILLSQASRNEQTVAWSWLFIKTTANSVCAFILVIC